MIQAASPETETPLDLQDPLALLTVGVRIAPVDTKKMGTFVHSGWTCVCYPTTAEATRRAALLTMPAGAVNEEVRAATEESMAIMKEI